MVGRGVWFATGAEEWQTAGAACIRRFIPHPGWRCVSAARRWADRVYRNREGITVNSDSSVPKPCGWNRLAREVRS